jgi:hypothetical protein
MPATRQDELRLAGSIARKRLLELRDEYAHRIAHSARWREEYLTRCDEELDRAIDRASDLAHKHGHALSTV